MAKNLIVVAIFLVFTLVVGVAFAYFGGTSIPGGNGAAASTTVTSGATPTLTTPDASTVTVSWAASTLATGQAVTGYVVKRYDANTLTAQTILTACTGTIAVRTCTENNLPTGQWRYSITPSFATNWLGAESAKSSPVSTIEKDVTPPVNVLTSTVVTGKSFKNLNTIYYLGSSAGSFTVTNALTDAASGPASSTTQALTGTTTGWTHTGSKVSTPTDGPYVSNSFSWAAGTTTTPAEAVVGRDVQDNSASTTLTFTNDITGPVAAVSYLNGYEAGRSVAVTFSNSDAGSGVATRQLQRSSAPLTSATGVCGTYTSFARIGPVNPNSIYTDSQVANATCYKYRYVVTDQLGNQTIATSANVVKIDYQGATAATAGLLSQWRLGESYTATDSFTGTAGTSLLSRTGETGATWTKWVNDSSSAVLTDAGRLRRNAVGGVTYFASGVAAIADYQVSTDVVLKTSIAGDYAGVVGRALLSDTTGQGTRYTAVYNTDAGAWQLRKSVAGTLTVLGTYTQALTANQSYAVTLDMRGSAIRLLVDAVERVSVTDSAITGTGRAGVVLGSGTTGVSPTNTTGMHTDNFRIIPRAVDGKGVNPGMYMNAPTLGVAGAINGDPDTATAFDGSSEYVQMTNTVGLPLGASVRSVEAWFKTTSTAQQVIFSYGNRAPDQEFGLWLDAGGSSLQTWGHTHDYSFSASAPLNDGVWHQAVTTYDGTSLTVYVDGVSLGSQAANRNTVLESYGFGIGAIIAPGDLNSGKYFNGVLDEVSFYTTVLNPDTISNHYALGTSDPADVAGPTGGSVDATGLIGTGARYSTSTTLSLAFATGTDPSGIADSGAQLLRATGTLTSAGGTADGVCSSFGSYTQVGGEDPTSPVADTVADQACYSYRYVVMDSLGNATTYTSPGIKVETTAPVAPTLSYSALTNTYWSGTGSAVVYYRSAATSGSFTATAAGTDPKSGIASYAFPALGTNWTSTAGSLGVNTYAWSGAPAAPGTKQVTATNNATLTSANSPFTLTADDNPPTAGTVSNEASTRATSTNITFATGTDSGSGIGTRLLQRQSATLTGSTCGSYGAFATVTNGTNPTSPLANTVATGNCYKYQYVVSDNVGNSTTASSATVLKVSSSYAATVNATASLLNYYRLGESNPGVLDSFTGTAGTALSAHTADSGDAWTRRTGDTITAVLSNAGRLRKSTVSGGVGYYSNEVLTGADYLVETDITVKSLAGSAGVLGRGDINGAGTGTYYYARYDAGAGQFQLIKNINGNAAVLGTPYNQTLTVGSTYTLGLDMRGTTIRVLVNDVQRITSTDSGITTAGRAGVGFGEPGDAATPSETAGLHLDNFNVPGGLIDSDNGNNGTYVNGPTVGVTGALTGDSDTAATFDGVNDFGRAPRQVSDDLSIEFWFKSTQGIGTATQWYDGAGLVDASLPGAANDFGVSLRSDGKVVAGVGSSVSGSDVSITSSSSGYNNGAWHHVVFTRVKTGGAIKLYVDGALAASGTGATASLTGQANLSFASIAGGSNFYAGSLDEIAVYNSALSATAVADHFAAR